MSDFEERGRAPEQLVEAVAADDHDVEADESKKYLKSRHYLFVTPAWGSRHDTVLTGPAGGGWC